MSSTRSDSDTDCELNPLEDSSDNKIGEESKQHPSAVKRPRPSGDRNSKLWDIFEKISSEAGLALCRLCDRKFSYRTSITNLKKHLEYKHPLEMGRISGILPASKRKNSENGEQLNKKAEEKDYTSDSQALRPPRSSSIAWKYFSVESGRGRRARCNLCSKLYSYATTVTNLLTHLERCHHNVHLQHYPHSQSTPTSPLWAYYKCVDETLQLACCLLCKKRVEYSEECRELRRHLIRKHPHVDLEDSSAGKTFMVTDNGDLFEIDVSKSEPVDGVSDNDGNEPYEEDYLDETMCEESEEKIKDKPKQSPTKKRMFSQKLPKPQSEVLESSNPKEITKEVEDSLDIFGRYIVSLLKNMPKNVSDKLQYQIVKQIFEAQNEIATTVKENNVTSNSEISPAIVANND